MESKFWISKIALSQCLPQECNVGFVQVLLSIISSITQIVPVSYIQLENY